MPVVGPVFEDAGEEVVEAGHAAAGPGARERADVHTAAVLFGLAVFLVPSLPLLFTYAPHGCIEGGRRERSGRSSETTPTTRTSTSCSPSARVAHLPYHRLRALGAPGHATDRVLADAELAREGVTRL